MVCYAEGSGGKYASSEFGDGRGVPLTLGSLHK